MDTQNAAAGFIETLKSQIVEIDVQIGPLLQKRKLKAALANATAADAGLPLPFPNEDGEMPAASAPVVEAIAPDQFTGKKMATACREIMQRRKARGGGPIFIDELYTTLKSGGYAFRAIGKENGITSLSTTLGKNTQFRRVPGNASLWGLAEWYGGPVKRTKSASAGGNQDGDDDEDEVIEDAPQTTSAPASGAAK